MGGFLDRVAEAAGRLRPRDPEGYDRARILPRLIPVDPGLVADLSPEGRRRILQLLARALRGERQRGRAGHWTYSLDRHLGLVSAFKAERQLARLAGASGGGGATPAGFDVARDGPEGRRG